MDSDRFFSGPIFRRTDFSVESLAGIGDYTYESGRNDQAAGKSGAPNPHDRKGRPEHRRKSHGQEQGQQKRQREEEKIEQNH